MKELYLLTTLILVFTFTVSNAEEENKDPMPVGTGIGQLPAEDEVTRLGNNSLMAEYIPLDKGNVWTYELKQGDSKSEHTQKVVSVSDGWSVFDNYFGIDGISLRIAPGGELLVTKDGKASSFYGEKAVISYPDSVDTPAGKYEQPMVVTAPGNKRLTFRDVYIKGVGLVFHEHKSPKGEASYTLIKGNVRGIEYPVK